MRKVIRCDCGYVARGDNDHELVRVAQLHARDAHGIELSPDQALAMAEPA